MCSSRCVCMPSFLDCPNPFLYPFTQPLSAPVLGACPVFKQVSVCSQLWQPAMLLFLTPFPTILESSQLLSQLPYTTIPLQHEQFSKGQKEAQRSRHWHPEATWPTYLKEVRFCLSARLWKEGGDAAKVSSHSIMRLVICSFRPCVQIGFSLQKAGITPVKCSIGCQLPKFLNFSPMFMGLLSGPWWSSEEKARKHI